MIGWPLRSRMTVDSVTWNSSLDTRTEGGLDSAPTRRDLLYVLAGRTVTELEPTVLAALASLDGAMVTDERGHLISVGAILRHPYTAAIGADSIIEGARSTAAMTGL